MSLNQMKHKPDEIACLYEITTAIYATLDLRKALYKVLDLMSEHLGMNCCSIALLPTPFHIFSHWHQNCDKSL